MKPLILILFILTGLTLEEGSPIRNPEADPVKALEAPGSCSLINDWISVHLKTMRNGKVFNHHHRQSAYIGVALYESIVAGDKNYRSLADQLNGYQPPKPVTGINEICWPASANTALATMFRFFYPQDPAEIIRFDSLENTWKQHLLKEGYSEAAVNAGSLYGSIVSKAVIEWSKTDNNDKAGAAYDIPKGIGLWEPTPPKFVPPLTPFMGNNRTFVKGSIDNTMPPLPVAFSTDSQSAFFKMVEEVYKTSLMLDGDKKTIGLFWDDFPDGKTVTSGGHWASILKTVMEDRHISLIEGAHLYAALFISTNDAAIGCFKAKYTYNLLRPVTYIQKYMNHPDWNPMIVTPPHPEYPAAHATVSMAAAVALTSILGDKVSFTDNTYSYRGYKSHHFNNFVEAAREAGISRFYGGIHYKPSIEAGYTQGKKIADNVTNTLVFKK
jgi:PAP2 superfamily